jgi:hypothetical protein
MIVSIHSQQQTRSARLTGDPLRVPSDMKPQAVPPRFDFEPHIQQLDVPVLWVVRQK